MKLLTSLLFSLFVSTHLLACNFAVQNRIFPLGMTSTGIVVVEVRLDRGSPEIELTGNRSTIYDESAWSGRSYLKVYDQNQREISAEIIDSNLNISQLAYDSILQTIIEKGLLLTTQFSDFQRITSGKIDFCNYEAKCSYAKLIYDTINNTVSIQNRAGKHFVIPFSDENYTITADIKSIYLEPGNSVTDLNGLLLISSYRAYHINDRTVYVAHIAVGQDYSKHAEKYKKQQFSDIANSAFSEPVIYHSQGFDFVFWE